MKITEFKLDKLNQSTTLEVRIRATRQLKLRMFLAKRLIILGAKILGCGIEFKGADHVE